MCVDVVDEVAVDDGFVVDGEVIVVIIRDCLFLLRDRV